MLLEEAISCKYKFELAVELVAVILIVNGPPVIVKLYQPSLLKAVPRGQDVDVGEVAMFGAVCVASFIAAVPPGSHPFTAIASAVAQVVPWPKEWFINNKMIKRNNLFNDKSEIESL